MIQTFQFIQTQKWGLKPSISFCVTFECVFWRFLFLSSFGSDFGRQKAIFRNRDIFSRPIFLKTKPILFSRPNFPKPRPRLYSETKFSENKTETFEKLAKVSKLRSFETERSISASWSKSKSSCWSRRRVARSSERRSTIFSGSEQTGLLKGGLANMKHCLTTNDSIYRWVKGFQKVDRNCCRQLMPFLDF